MNKKIWLITGISSGLGKSLANAAMEKGHFVIGTFRKEQQAEEFNVTYGDKGKAFVFDVTHLNSANKLVDQVKKDFRKIDVLVNNAGVGFVGAIEESSIEEVRSIFEPNFYGALNMTQAVLPLMRDQKNGHIIQISSHGGVKAFAGFGIYNASKFALEGFSEAMAQEIAPLGIKTTIVEPGPFRTKFAGDTLVMAKKEIADYDETAGAFRKKLKGVDGVQEGDPDKAAMAILDVAEEAEPPLRLPLGKTALVTIGMKLESVKNDLENNRKTAENTVF